MADDSGPALVTGASGFLGHHLVARLVAEGRAVHALCRDPAPLHELASSLASIRCGDIGDPDLYADLLDGRTTVFHLAGIRDPAAPPREHRRINVEALDRLARSAMRAGVHRFIHLSSALAFGPSDGRPRDESDPYDREWGRFDPYVGSRIEAAARLRELEAAGLTFVIVSPAIVYGPDHSHRPNRVTERIRRLRRWSVLPVLGDEPRSLVFVGDVVECLLGAERLVPIGEELIVSGEAVTPKGFDETVRSVSGLGGVSIPLPSKLEVLARLAIATVGGDALRGLPLSVRRLTARWMFDGSRAQELVRFRPTPLVDGVRRTLAHVTPRRDRQLRRWEEIASSMRDFSGAPTTRYYRRREQELIERTVGSLAGRRVLKLDLWNEAINTRILNWMRSEGAEAVGLDWSGVVAARARGNALLEDGEPLRLVRGDIRELPFASGSFDLVYTMGTIEHIDEYRLAVAEIERVLRPGGTALIGVPHRWDPFLRPLLVWLLARLGRYPYAPEKSFGVGELRRVVEGAGLEVERRTGILAMPGLLRMLDLFLHTRGRTSRRLIPAVLVPFEFLETRFESMRRRVGYLLTLVASKRGR